MRYSSGLRLRWGAGVLTVAVAGAVGLALLTPAPEARAATGCTASYRVDQWTGGFTAYVDVTAGATAVHGWTVTWTYGAGQQITSSWSAQVAQSGSKVTASNLSWNADLSPGVSTEFGLQGAWTGSNPAPTDITVTGTGCAATATASPSVTASASASASPSASASASPSAGASSSASSSPSAPASSGPPPAGCTGAVLCDGFENLAAGTPTGSWTLSFPNCSGAGTAAIDTTTAHSGGKSLKVTGAAGYCNHVFVSPTQSLSTIGPVWYARFYVRHTTALPPDHVAFLAMKDANDGGNDLRMGGQNSALQWNRQSDDATLPDQSPAGVAQSVPLPTNQWTCLEFMVNGTAGTMDTWVNGTQVPGLHEDGVKTQDVDDQWLGRSWHPSLTDFRIGWEAYGNGSDTLWYDDVALGSSRIGC